MLQNNRSRWVIGNWKLHGGLKENAKLLADLKVGIKSSTKANVGVSVPFPYLAQLQSTLTGSSIVWGSQDVSRYARGAFTGEVSAAMVSEFGAHLAIVGHSERRGLMGETDIMVAEKFGQAKAVGLMPVLCVGETLEERNAGQTEAVVRRQLEAVINVHGVASLTGAIVAYEPVWAVGTGQVASPQQAEAVHAFLRNLVVEKDENVAAMLPLLYGGSLKANNAAALFAEANIDGGLVGGAALQAAEFLGIVDALA